MTHLRKALPLVVAAAMLAACAPAGMAPAPVAPAGIVVVAGQGRLTASLQAEVTPAQAPAAQRRLMANVYNHTKASIHHLVVELYDAQGAESLIQSVDVPAAALDHPIRFVGLRENHPYRVKSYAYKTADVSQKISIDADSDLDFNMGIDDRKTIALPVKLTDVPFSGRASTSGLSVVDGGHVTSGGEFIRAGALLTPACRVTTLNDDRNNGFNDGILAAAQFNNPNDLVVVGDAIYVADTDNHRIRKIQDGEVTTILGDGSPATVDGPLASARCDHPVAIAADPDGNLYFLQSGSQMKDVNDDDGDLDTDEIRPDTFDADDDGDALENYPDINDLDGDGVYDEDGTLKVQTLRKIDTAGNVTTIAGGFRDGSSPGTKPGRQTRFAEPADLAVDPDGSRLFVADPHNAVIQMVELQPANNYPTRNIAGVQGQYSPSNNPVGLSANLGFPGRVTCDLEGNVLFLDSMQGVIRKITMSGSNPVTAYVGSNAVATNNTELAQVDGRNGTFRQVGGIAVDAFGGILAFDIEQNLGAGNEAVQEEEFHILRRVAFDNTGAPVLETLAGDPINWAQDGVGFEPTLEFSESDPAGFTQSIGGMDFDARGVLYFIDKAANAIRSIELLPPEETA